MSRRTAIVEEFDDDTDIALPTQTLPNTGTRGAILEEIGSDDSDPDLADLPDDDDIGNFASASASAGSTSLQQSLASSQQPPTVQDLTPYKSWTCIYPIYIDAKRAYGTGERRISRAKSVWWPLSKDIADATSRLGLGTLHEVNKCHPRDWDNPGRIRVQWKRDGKLVNAHIKTKKQLLEMVSFQIQAARPEYVPAAPYTFPPPRPDPPITTKQKLISKGKHAQPKAKGQSSATSTRRGCMLPVPPEPLPAIASRLSSYSPAIVSGVLIDTIKAGMNAQESGAAGPPVPNMGQKGKRKVVRVRG